MTEFEDQLTGMLHQRAADVRIDDRLDVITTRVGNPSAAHRHRRRHRMVFATAAVLLVVAGAVVVWQVGDSPPSAPSATDSPSTTSVPTTSSTTGEHHIDQCPADHRDDVGRAGSDRLSADLPLR